MNSQFSTLQSDEAKGVLAVKEANEEGGQMLQLPSAAMAAKQEPTETSVHGDEVEDVLPEDKATKK
jgi:hypothetical protein